MTQPLNIENAPLLSVLIPSIPSRVPLMANLLHKLDDQIGDLPVEVLVLIDNKKRSIGLKRQSLLEEARGKFVAFVDDDDDVMPDYITSIVSAIKKDPDVDVIVFDQLCSFNDSPPVIIRFGIEYKADTQVNLAAEPAAYRRPWHVMAWRRGLAAQGRFADKMYSEDSAWVDEVAPLATSQTRINKPLIKYRYNDEITEAVHGE